MLTLYEHKNGQRNSTRFILKKLPPCRRIEDKPAKICRVGKTTFEPHDPFVRRPNGNCGSGGRSSIFTKSANPF